MGRCSLATLCATANASSPRQDPTQASTGHHAECHCQCMSQGNLKEKKMSSASDTDLKLLLGAPSRLGNANMRMRDVA